MGATQTPALPAPADRYNTGQAAALLGVDVKTVARMETQGLLRRAADQAGRGTWFDGPSVEAERAKILSALGAADLRVAPPKAVVPVLSQHEAAQGAPGAPSPDEPLRRQLVRAQEEGRRAMRLLRDALAGMDGAFVPEDPQLLAEMRNARAEGGMS